MPRGRPVGSGVTVDSLVEKENLEWVKVQAEIRETISGQVAELKKILAEGQPALQVRLEILSGLCNILPNAAKALESGSKIVKSQQARPEVEDEAAVAAELLE